MDRRAQDSDCLRRSTRRAGIDNAVAESFFATLEKDLLRRRSFATRQEARTAVFDYLEAFYNPVRLHSTLDYLSSVEYEKLNREEEKAA